MIQTKTNNRETNLRNAYREQIEKLTGQLIEHYQGLLTSAMVVDKITTQRDNLDNNIHASKIIVSAESLLKLIAKMKQSILIGDFQSRLSEVNESEKQLQTQQKETQKLLDELKNDLSISLFSLEKEFYSPLDQK